MFPLFCDRMTVSLSTRRFEWISVHFGILLVRSTMTTTFRVCAFEANELVLGWMRTNGMLTHTYFDRMPLLFAFERCFFPQFLFTTSVFALNWFTFFVGVVVGYYFNDFFFRFLFFGAVSLSISILRFSFHPRPAIPKVHHSTTHFIFLALKQINKPKKRKKERKRRNQMLEKVIISVMGKFLCI